MAAAYWTGADLLLPPLLLLPLLLPLPLPPARLLLLLLLLLVSHLEPRALLLRVAQACTPSRGVTVEPLQP